MKYLITTEQDRVQANAEAFGHLLELSDRLRRTNSTKWGISREEWLAAVQEALKAPESRPNDSPASVEAIQLARVIIRRLCDSAEARLAAASVGNHPDISRAGQRFYKDLKLAHQRFKKLQTLME